MVVRPKCGPLATLHYLLYGRREDLVTLNKVVKINIRVLGWLTTESTQNNGPNRCGYRHLIPSTCAAPSLQAKSPQRPLIGLPPPRGFLHWRLSNAGPAALVRVESSVMGPASETRHKCPDLSIRSILED